MRLWTSNEGTSCRGSRGSKLFLYFSAEYSDSGALRDSSSGERFRTFGEGSALTTRTASGGLPDVDGRGGVLSWTTISSSTDLSGPNSCEEAGRSAESAR